MKAVFNYRVIKFTVRISGEAVPISENIIFSDDSLVYLTGIAVATVEGPYSGSLFRKFYLNSEEFFPTDFEVRLLAMPQNIAHQNRFYSMNIHCKTNLHFEIEYKDADSEASYPYNVNIHFRFEIQKRSMESAYYLGEKI